MYETSGINEAINRRYKWSARQPQSLNTIFQVTNKRLISMGDRSAESTLHVRDPPWYNGVAGISHNSDPCGHVKNLSNPPKWATGPPSIKKHISLFPKISFKIKSRSTPDFHIKIYGSLAAGQLSPVNAEA